MKQANSDKQVLLSVGDGPEGIEIYTSENEGVVDWSSTFPALYIVVTIDGALAKFGPFTLPSINAGIQEALKL